MSAGALVLDASVVVELLLGTSLGGVVARRLASSDDALHAPHLMGVEVTQVLRRHARAGIVSPERATEAVEDLLELDVVRHDHEPFLPRAWELRENVTAYDGLYLALAEVLGAPLLTADGPLARSPGHRAAVELIE